jgi:hypothetical protein
LLFYSPPLEEGGVPEGRGGYFPLWNLSLLGPTTPKLPPSAILSQKVCKRVKIFIFALKKRDFL